MSEANEIARELDPPKSACGSMDDLRRWVQAQLSRESSVQFVDNVTGALWRIAKAKGCAQ